MMLTNQIQNKMAWVLLTLVTLVLVGVMAGVVRGGPLDPPGPVAPTGKTVITSLPYTISQPGSYVLNGNLTCTTCTSGQSGITVNASNVTIDLQGFDLVGVPAAGEGIDGTQANLTVLNGTVRDWGNGHGIFADAGLRVDSVNVINADAAGIWANSDATITNCQVEGSGWHGVHVGQRAVISNCTAKNNGFINGGNGFDVGDASVITESVATANKVSGFNAGQKATLENCTADTNGDPQSQGAQFGIRIEAFSVLRGCTAANNADTEIYAHYGSVVEDCVADGNGTAGPGIIALGNVVVRGCTAQNNGGNEIWATGSNVVLENCVADGVNTAGNGIEVLHNTVIRGCTATNNGNDEISAGNQALIEDCVAEGWNGSARGAGDGISVGAKATIRGCIVTNNAAAGILLNDVNNRVENNEVTDNGGIGIYLFSTGNVGLGNRSQGNVGQQCFVAASNNFITVTGATFGGATHPWMNLC
jgi:parallel beta-helix repeat protein